MRDGTSGLDGDVYTEPTCEAAEGAGHGFGTGKAQWRLDGHKAGLAGKPDSPPWFFSDEKAIIWREGWAAGAMEKASRNAAASDASQKDIPAGPLGD